MLQFDIPRFNWYCFWGVWCIWWTVVWALQSFVKILQI